MLCHDCRMLLDARSVPPNKALSCPRCSADLHFRKQRSITTTWALVVTAAILFIPANVLPIMRVEFLGATDYSTIMDGILYFLHEQEYGIGLIIFVASILVPLFKIVGLAIVLLSITFNWKRGLRHKTMMYQFIVFVGRWSMLDIFVIALMATIVDFGALSSTLVAPAASYFAAVVITTMFAATSFDSRLLWDA